jgi:AcrR family transcriptional regulator
MGNSVATVETQAWVDVALAEMAHGVDAVRVEVVAQRLGVTKGGFYRRFKDRRALLDAMLDKWTAGRIAAIESQTDLSGNDPAERLAAIVRLFVARRNTQGLAIELAIRQWAQGDARAADAVLRVDRARLAHVANLYARLGLSEADAQARSVLFYAFIFGQSSLVLAPTAEARAELINACAALLIAPQSA